jgi:uncharacterized membrane protein
MLEEHMPNKDIIGYGIMKLCELINRDEIDLSTTINLLNDGLKKIDSNSDNYIEKVNAITGLILQLKENKEKTDKETFMKKMFYIQTLFDLNSLSKIPEK